MNTPNHWILRVDNSHFRTASPDCIWGLNTITNFNMKGFVKRAKEGDVLWFVTSKTKTDNKRNPCIAVATFKSAHERILGPIIAISKTDEELGWIKRSSNPNSDWNMELIYKDLRNLTPCGLSIDVKGQSIVLCYDESKYDVDLRREYTSIMRYAGVTTSMS